MKRSRQSDEGIENKRVKSDAQEASDDLEPKEVTSNLNESENMPSVSKRLEDEAKHDVKDTREEEKEAKDEGNEKEAKDGSKDSEEQAGEKTEKEPKEETKDEAKHETSEVSEPAKEEHPKDDSQEKSKENAEPETKNTNDESTNENKDENKVNGQGSDDGTKTKNDSVEPTAAKPAKPSGFSSFGSGFSGFSGFSGAKSKFSSLASTPKSNPWAEKPQNDQQQQQNEQDKKPESSASSESKDTVTSSAASSKTERETPPENDTFAQVKLAKQDVKTGEENEESLYQVRVRLYAIDLTDTEQKSWKERGTGLLKLNKSDKEKYRLVMRADGVLRVALNIPLVQNMQVSKGFPTSLHTEKFVKFAGIEDGKAHQYAVKCGSEALRDELFDAITGIFQR